MTPPRRWLGGTGAICAWLCMLAMPCAWANSSRICQSPQELSATEQDRLIQVAALLKAELQASGHRVAIVARSGQALQRLGHRYSHAGVSLRDSPNTPWSVRQLYLACNEDRPRIFDQGLPGFVMGMNDPTEGYVAVQWLPPDAAAALQATSLNDTQALQLLGAGYSANAHALSTRYQNCNQWLAELLATAWGQPANTWATERGDDTPSPTNDDARHHAQQWLTQKGYTPSVLAVPWPPLMWAAALLPWFHVNDHPAEDLEAGQFRVSMPASITAWVQARWPQAPHWELCHTTQHVLLRRNGPPIAQGCHPEPGDQMTPLAATNQLNK